MSKAEKHFADYALFLEDFKTKLYEEAVDNLASLYQSNGDIQVKMLAFMKPET